MLTWHDLKLKPIWCVYTLTPRGNGKMAKIPHSAVTGDAIDTQQPDVLTDGATAAAAYRSNPRAAGVGIVLPDDVVCIDIDDAFHYQESDGYRRLKDVPRQIVQMFDGTFIETSISGQGLHVFCHASSPQRTIDADNGLEIFGGGAFIAMTWHAYGRRDLPLIDAQPIVDALLVIPEQEPAQTAAQMPENRPLAAVGNQKGGVVLDDVVGALRAIEGGIEYRQWVGVVAGMVADLGEKLTDELISKYNWQKPKEVQRIARSVERNGARASLGKLYYAARQNGYNGPWRVAN